MVFMRDGVFGRRVLCEVLRVCRSARVHAARRRGRGLRDRVDAGADGCLRVRHLRVRRLRLGCSASTGISDSSKCSSTSTVSSSISSTGAN